MVTEIMEITHLLFQGTIICEGQTWAVPVRLWGERHFSKDYQRLEPWIGSWRMKKSSANRKEEKSMLGLCSQHSWQVAGTDFHHQQGPGENSDDVASSEQRCVAGPTSHPARDDLCMCPLNLNWTTTSRDSTQRSGLWVRKEFCKVMISCKKSGPE